MQRTGQSQICSTTDRLMGWETRRGHRYYYLKQRLGNRVRSIYVGSCPHAERAAAQLVAFRSGWEAVKAAGQRSHAKARARFEGFGIGGIATLTTK